MKSALFTMLALTLATAAHAADVLKVGDVIPADVAVTDQLGKHHTMGEFRGKPLVLEWTNPGCPFVRKFYESGTMQKQQAATVANNVTWLAVNSGAKGKEGHIDAANAPAEVAKSDFKGTAYILDGEGTLGKMFGAQTTPHMFVADKDGKIVYAGAIDSIPSFSKDDIAKAENYVVSALASLAKGEAVATPSTRSYGCSVKY